MIALEIFAEIQTSHSRLKQPERRLLCPERDGPLHVSYDHVLRPEIKRRWTDVCVYAHGTVRLQHQFLDEKKVQNSYMYREALITAV